MDDRRIVYHGTNGDNIINIMTTGVVRPNAHHEIFCSTSDWQSVLMYGADTRRAAAFAIKMEISVPEGATWHHVSTPGNPLTLKIQASEPIPARVLELFARMPTDDGFRVERVTGDLPIRSYLNT